MSIKRLQKVEGFDVKGFAVISEESMIPLCEKYGILWCMHENLPLGRKKNFGIEKALEYEFDYLIEIGSDDILKSEILEAYKWDAPVIGLMEFGLLNTVNGNCKRIKTNIPKFGAGRAIKREALGKLWPDNLSKGLDNRSNMHLGRNGFLAKGVKWDRPLVTALKGETNIWSFRAIHGHKHTIEEALNGLSEEEINAIQCLITKNKSASLMSV
jgi:hypothetical protein